MISIFKERVRYTYREFYDRIDRWNWMELVRILKIILVFEVLRKASAFGETLSL